MFELTSKTPLSSGSLGENFGTDWPDMEMYDESTQSQKSRMNSYNRNRGCQMKAAPIFCYSYTPMQEVAPNAVNTAVAIDAIICTTNLKVSFFVIVFCIFMEFKESGSTRSTRQML